MACKMRCTGSGRSATHLHKDTKVEDVSLGYMTQENGNKNTENDVQVKVESPKPVVPVSPVTNAAK